MLYFFDILLFISIENNKSKEYIQLYKIVKNIFSSLAVNYDIKKDKVILYKK